MVKSYILTVDEIDEASDAIEELREQLQDIKLLKNTIGIVSFHSDAVNSGVYKAVADFLPFPVAGATSAAQSANGEIGMYMFTIMVLTSDDCRFICGKTDEISEAVEAAPAVARCYTELKAKLSEKPKLALIYAPVLTYHFPGEYIEAIAGIDPEVAVFGSVASDVNDNTPERDYQITLCSGEASTKSVVIVLIEGDFKPEFFMTSFTDDAIMMRDVGVITKCDKNKLLEVNNMNAVDFFTKIGFKMGERSDKGLMTSTLILDYNKDDRSRSPFMIEDGAVLCFGYLREGAKISIAVSTPDVVVQTAREVTEKIKSKGTSTALIYSCIGRRVGLMNEPMKELEAIKEIMPPEINYMVGYASGELCPTSVTPEIAHNHEHNQTLVACVF